MARRGVTPSGPAADNARAAAVRVLGDVLGGGTPLEEAFATQSDGLSARDRAFARALATVSLRRLGQIDALIDHCLERPLPAGARTVRDILRIGTAQLLFLEVPAHAAVAATVELVGAKSKFRGLVNAILRRLSTSGRAMTEAQDAAMVNTPGWLWARWLSTYGAATCRAIAESHLHEPPLDITVKSAPAEWARRLEAQVLPTGSLRRAAGGAIDDLPGYDAGEWWIQDAAAAIPARLFGPLNGRLAIDLCAAPGGKTAELCSAGADVIAVDRNEGRMRRLAENLSRLNLAARTVVADVVDWRPDAPVDAVLLDAPCSATGTIRRHPDVAYLKSERDITVLTRVQESLLRSAAAMVRPGGLLIYCTCSLEPEEGPRLIEAFLGENAAFQRLAVAAPEIGGLTELIDDQGDLRTLPCHLAAQGGMDGFYAVRLRRTV